MSDEIQVEGEAGGRPEWLPEQFNRPEDLAKSYDETRREMDRMRSQLDTERAQFNAALEALETRIDTPSAQVQAEGYDPLTAAYAQAYETGDAQAMLRISAELASKSTVDAVGRVLDERLSELKPAIESQAAAQRDAQIRMAEDIVARQIGADTYQELLPSISELIKSRPHFLPQNATVEGYASALIDIAKLAQHDTLAKSVEQLEKERAEKLAAQGVTGAGFASAFTQDQQKAEFERVKATPLGTYSQIVSG